MADLYLFDTNILVHIVRSDETGQQIKWNQLLRFRAFPSTCPEFAAQIFRKCQKDGIFADVSTKTTSVAHLGSSRFSALELPWPPTLTKQQRIAECLSSLDDLITAETHKIKALKTHKKGLMQQLFPSLEEHTTI
jgi:type I restriction enzyme S subunit